MTEPQKEIVAVIDIGSSALRMIIAEIGTKSEIRYLENLQKPVRLGKDVFTTGKISNEVIRESIEILKNYKAVIQTYAIRKVQAIATSAVRDAMNRENFIDQVFVRTGLDVEIIEGPEENRLELIAVEHSLGDEVDLAKKNCLIVEVGSGSTELIILNQGQVELTRTLSIGSIRLPEQAVAGKTDAAVMQRVLKRNIHEVVAYAAKEFSFDQVDTFIALGADMRFASRQLCEKAGEKFVTIDKKAFLGFVQSVSKQSPDELSKQYGISYTEAESLYPSLLYYANFLSETKAETVIVPMTSIRDGLVLEIAQLYSGYKRTDVAKQVLNSARHLGARYQYDKTHAQCVAAISVKIFDLLKQDHGMGAKERLLLEVSALLHDIGSFISPVSHHKHSSYLVDAAEIFGLRKADKNIVSNVVRYHRRSIPRSVHVLYMSLPKSDRATVSKLAAILRVADALDHSHQQKIRSIVLDRSEDSITLWAPEESGDISIERSALVEKGNLFTEVFGLPVILKQGQPATARA